MHILDLNYCRLIDRARGDYKMRLSDPSVAAISDLISNRLAVMQVSDREDLREAVALRRALAELRGLDAVEAGILKTYHEIPRRGRRRKVGDMIAEHVAEANLRGC